MEVQKEQNTFSYLVRDFSSAAMKDVWLRWYYDLGRVAKAANYILSRLVGCLCSDDESQTGVDEYVQNLTTRCKKAMLIGLPMSLSRRSGPAETECGTRKWGSNQQMASTYF
jgi:hypothetical protein